MRALRRSPSITTLLLSGLTLSGSARLAQAPSPLHVDNADYTATCIEKVGNTCSYGFTLVARYENRTAETLYVSRCHPRDPTPQYGVETIEDTAERRLRSRVGVRRARFSHRHRAPHRSP